MIINNDMSALKLFLEYDKAHREHLRKHLLNEITCVPVADEILQQLNRLNPIDHAIVMKHHPGHATERAIKSLWTMLDVFTEACSALRANVQNFDALEQRTNVRSWQREKDRDGMARSMRRDVFAASPAAYALKELSRRVIKALDLGEGEFAAKRAELLHEGQNEFILALRRNLTHVISLMPNWRVSYGKDVKTTGFDFDKDGLLSEGNFGVSAKSFLDGSPKQIDIVNLFEDYCARINRLYAWLKLAINERGPIALQDYRRCVQAHQTLVRRQWWKLVLESAIRRKADPYRYLADHLEPAELAEIENLPKHSVEQLDRIITVIDKQHDCDDELRALVLNVFQCSQI